MQVLLARHKAEEQFYAVKVLQKKAILKKKEVSCLSQCHCNVHQIHFYCYYCASVLNINGFLCFQEKHIMSERNVLLKNVKHPFLVGLHFSFQTADKLYFVLDYINGGEVSSKKIE